MISDCKQSLFRFGILNKQIQTKDEQTQKTIVYLTRVVISFKPTQKIPFILRVVDSTGPKSTKNLNKMICLDLHQYQLCKQSFMTHIDRLKETIELSHSIIDGKEHINLYSKGISDTAIRVLRELEWKNIHIMQLSHNDIWSDGAFEISRLGYKSLQALILDMNKIGDKGLEHLINADWKQLRKLTVAHNEIGPQGAKKLVKSNWPKLQKISLDTNLIGFQGVKYFNQTNWSNLKELYLWNCDLGRKGIKSISKCNWQYLQIVWLGLNQFSDEAVQYLYKTQWKNLTELNLNHNHITKKSIWYLLHKDIRKMKNLMLSQQSRMEEGTWIQLLRLQSNELERLYLHCQERQENHENIRARLKQRFPELFQIQV